MDDGKELFKSSTTKGKYNFQEEPFILHLMACHRTARTALRVAMVFMLIARTSGVGKTSAENRLIKDLFENYDPIVRPVLDPMRPVLIKTSYFLMSLGNVDERAQSVSLHGFLQLTWTDEFLTWTPEDYGNIETIFVPVEKMWVPDILFDNGVGEQFYKKEDYCPRIQSDGRVRWEVGGEMELLCDFAMHDYPFDEQQCKMEVVTWAGTDDHIKLYGDIFDIKTYYQEHSSWDVSHSYVTNFTYTEEGEAFTEIHFHFEIGRKSLSDVLNVVIPVMLLSVLNGMVFLLPAESGEKIGMSLTLLLSFTVLQYTIDSSIPSQSDTPPLLDIYITLFVVCSCLAVAVTVFSVRLHFQSKPITESAKKFLRVYNKIARLIRCTMRTAVDVAPPEKLGETMSHEFTWSKVSSAFDSVWCVAYYLFFFVATTVILIKLIHFS